MSGDGETFFVDKVDFIFDGCVGAHRDVGTFGCAVCNIGGREGRADTQVCPYGVYPPINKSCGTFHDYGRSHLPVEKRKPPEAPRIPPYAGTTQPHLADTPNFAVKFAWEFKNGETAKIYVVFIGGTLYNSYIGRLRLRPRGPHTIRSGNNL